MRRIAPTLATVDSRLATVEEFVVDKVEIAASLLVLPPADVWQPDPKLTCYGGMRVQPQQGMQVRVL